MSILLCTICDRQFDTDNQVEAEYDPAICEDCLMQAEEQKQQWWESIDDDEQWIRENSQ